MRSCLLTVFELFHFRNCDHLRIATSSSSTLVERKAKLISKLNINQPRQKNLKVTRKLNTMLIKQKKLAVNVQFSELSPIEQIRLDNIKECREKMLGLLKPKLEAIVKPKRSKISRSSAPVRKSGRLANKK